jgi:putative ABC transport system permease protein
LRAGYQWGRFFLALRLARRELRGGLKGFRVFLACLALGVAAISGVGSVSDAMMAGLRADGRVLLGGDLDLRLNHREATAEQLAWMLDHGQVSVVTELRTMARATGPEAPRKLVELRAVDNLYPLYGETILAPPVALSAALAFAEGTWGAAVERTLLRRLSLAVGDLLKVGDTNYRVRTVLEREPDRTNRAFALGPRVMVAFDSLAGSELLQPGSLAHYHYRLRLPETADVLAVRQELDAAFPEAGWRVRDSRAASPGVRRFIERVTLFLTLVGLASLLVGGVGIGNAVRSYLDGKTATIATLKCVGASGRLIFRVYLTQILSLSLLGIAVGLTVGGLAPLVVGAVLGDQLGWRTLGGFYPVPLAVGAAFGVLTTLAFSLWPIARAQSVPAASLFRDKVAPAQGHIGWRTLAGIGLSALLLGALAIWNASDGWLAAYFVAGSVAALVVFRLAGAGLIALARRVPRPRHASLRLAIANLHRPGAPTGSVVMSLGLGITVLVALALVEGNLSQQVNQNLPREAPGFYFIDIQADQAEDFDRLVSAQAGVREVRRVPMLRGRIAAVNGTPPTEMKIPDQIEWVFRGDRGLTWSATPVEGAELTAGRWWPEDYDGDPLVSLDDEVARLLGLEVGDSLTINVLGRDFLVTIANLRLIDWSSLSINFVMVFSPGLLEAAPQSHIATVRAEPAVEDELERVVTDRFANVSSIRVKEALETVGEIIGRLAIAVRTTASVALVAGILVLAGAVAAGHRRRVYDAVVLKVLGATRWVVGQAFLMEYGLLGLATAGLAAVIGTLAAYLVLTEVMHMPFIFLPGAVIVTALMAAVVTLALGFAGTWQALSHKAAPLLRNE